MDKFFIRILTIVILLEILIIQLASSFENTTIAASGQLIKTRSARKVPNRKKRIPKKGINCICGKKTQNTRKIVGGNLAKEHAHPWMGALVSEDNSKPNLLCGSSLINDRYVLTAAHCVYKSVDSDTKKYKVYFGTNQVDGTNAKKYDISSVTTHPKYNPRTLDYDIALIKLSKPVTMSSTVKPICLSRSGVTYNGRVSNVAGWGTLKKGGSPVNELRTTHVKVVRNEDCARNYSTSAAKITLNMLCATLPGKDSCSGDSGGPLIFKDTSDDTFRQIGIVSFGIGCGSTRFSGVYTRVSRFINFIRTNTGDARYCSKSF